MTDRIVRRRHWWGDSIHFDNTCVLRRHTLKLELLGLSIGAVALVFMFIYAGKINTENTDTYAASIVSTYNYTDIMYIAGRLPLRCDQIQCCILRVDGIPCYSDACRDFVVADRVYEDDRQRPRCRQAPITEFNGGALGIFLLCCVGSMVGTGVIYFASKPPELVARVLHDQGRYSYAELKERVARLKDLVCNYAGLYRVTYHTAEGESASNTGERADSEEGQVV